jgi:hypothetical protein
MHPSIAPMDFVRENRDINRLIDYLKNQQEHHKKITFEEEYRILLQEYGIIPDERFFP